MAGHTSMPPRTQKTPFGDVKLTSRWLRDHYVLCASGTLDSIKWMFPKMTSKPEVHGARHRHVFVPAPQAVTVERELRRICAAWQAHWDNLLADHTEGMSESKCTPVTPQTLKEVYEHHQVHYAGLLGARTAEQYPTRMQGWFDYVGADTPLTEITAEVILAARAKMQKDDQSSNSTINGKVSTLKKILNMAHRKGWVTMASWRDVPPLRVIREPVSYWNAEQVAVAFSVASKDPQPGRAILMLVLGIYLGLRKNEAVHLRWCDLLLDRVHPQTGKPSPVCLIQQRAGFTTKTYENRKIPISAEGERLLSEHKPAEAQQEDYVLDAERHHEKRGGTKRVYRYDPVKVWARVLKAAKALGNPRIEFKEMRHSFACNCLLAGHSVEKIARWLGHKDPRMVRQHYAFLLDYDEDTCLKFLSDDDA